MVRGHVTGFAFSNILIQLQDHHAALPIKASLVACYGISKEASRVNEILGIERIDGFWVNGCHNIMLFRFDGDVERHGGFISSDVLDSDGLIWGSAVPYASFLALIFAYFQ